MSLVSVIVPTSLRNTAGPLPTRTGASSSSWMLPPSVALVAAIRTRSPVRTFPEGTTVLDRPTAATTSSGDSAYCRNRWHEGARAVDVADDLRHCLAHVGAGMEDQLHQGGALDVLRFDVLDAGD